jgi:hypothetical protein
MRTITVGFGREVNGPYDGPKPLEGKSRGVWLLPLIAWTRLQAEVIGIIRQYGNVLFAGTGHGVNTVTGQADEPGFVVVIEYNGKSEGADGILRGVQSLQDNLSVVARKYGQLEFAFTDGQSETVGVSNVES